MQDLWFLNGTGLREWTGVLLGWLTIPVLYGIATRTPRLWHPSYVSYIRCCLIMYLLAGGSISTILSWQEIVDPYGSGLSRDPLIGFVLFILGLLIWPLYIPALPFIAACTIEILTHDFTC